MESAIRIATVLHSVPPREKCIVGSLLRTIACSARPLYINELRVLHVIASGSSYTTTFSLEAPLADCTNESIKALLGPLVVISAEYTVVLSHPFLREYLIGLAAEDSTELGKDFGVKLDRDNLSLARSCMAYLSLGDFRNDMFSPPSSPKSEHHVSPLQNGQSSVHLDDIDDGNLFGCSFPEDHSSAPGPTCDDLASLYHLFDYASMHWAKHFSVSNKLALPDDHASAIELFYNENWLRYFRTKRLDFNVREGKPLFDPIQFCQTDMVRHYLPPSHRYRHDFEEFILEDGDPLFSASQFSLTETVRHYLGQHPDRWTELGGLLLLAIPQGHLNCVHTILQLNKALLHCKDDKGKTLLGYAISSPAWWIRYQIVVLLLENGVDLSVEESDGRNHFSLAAACTDDRVLRRLIDVCLKRPDFQKMINKADNRGRTPLSWSITEQCVDNTQLLLQYVEQLGQQDDEGRTPLLLAAAATDGLDAAKMIVEETVKRGMELDKKGPHGRSPLLSAAANGCLDVVKLLVDNHADPGLRDDNGQTALSLAAQGGHLETSRFLLTVEQGNMFDNKKRTPLSWAAANGSFDVVKLLANSHANPELADNNGRTALSQAAERGHTKIVRFLLGKDNVNPSSEDKKGQTPMYYAARNHHEGVVKLLVSLGEVHSDSWTLGGRTHLSLAVETGDERMVLIILKTADADPNFKDRDGCLPLLLAAQNGNTGLVRALLRYGAMPSNLNGMDKTLLPEV